MSKASQSSERWRLLRDSLRASLRPDYRAGDVDYKLPNPTHGFALFPRRKVEDQNVEKCGNGLAIFEYTMPCGARVLTREYENGAAAGGRTLSIQEIFSHRLHGVDNTGNVRVWAAEQVLLRVLLLSAGNEAGGPIPSCWTAAFATQKCPAVSGRLLEIGAGMTGLAGLGMAAAVAKGVAPTLSQVVVTDGNPDAVMNMEKCVELNRAAGGFGCEVSAHKLLWQASAGANKGKFDIVIGADCLFFKDYHADLVGLLRNLLTREGLVVLCQPRRGSTTSLFLAQAEPYFHYVEVDSYDEEVGRLDQDYQRNAGESYDRDIHYPLLILMRLKLL